MYQTAIKKWVESSGLNMNHSIALVMPGKWDEGKLFCWDQVTLIADQVYEENDSDPNNASEIKYTGLGRKLTLVTAALYHGTVTSLNLQVQLSKMHPAIVIRPLRPTLQDMGSALDDLGNSHLLLVPFIHIFKSMILQRTPTELQNLPLNLVLVHGRH